MTGEETNSQETSIPTANEIEAVKRDRVALKTENDAYEAEQLRAEKIRAQQRMAGKAQISQQEIKKEESPGEYAKRIMRGGK